jgi:hypothetical protein
MKIPLLGRLSNLHGLSGLKNADERAALSVLNMRQTDRQLSVRTFFAGV